MELLDTCEFCLNPNLQCHRMRVNDKMISVCADCYSKHTKKHNIASITAILLGIIGVFGLAFAALVAGGGLN